MSAEEIARALVSEKLAACVNILSNVRSIYSWKGAVQDEREVLMIIKTRTASLPAVEKLVQSLHSYEVPEIISVRLDQAAPSYLAWLAAETTQPKKRRAL